MSIVINPQAEVTVCAPWGLDDEKILSFVRQKSHWIVTKTKEVLQRNQLRVIKEYKDGEEFLFLGKKCRLEILEKDIKRSHIVFDGLKWSVSIPINVPSEEKKDTIKNKLIDWYRQEAEEVLGGRIFHYARIVGIEPKKIAVRTQKRLWGNCNYNSRTIHLNWQIIFSPLNVVDYVVVHELCHLFVPNHSRRFWKKVEEIYPQYQLSKKWLRDHSNDMVLP
ncbi:MAG: M48 family metallopeptidase [Candidatus Omnitrophica bacterium]|nr:M48 family metallopeptidase [Candidatus Omnitrophota bacterium]